MAGYSETPLGRKLGIKEGTLLFPDGAPREYLRWAGSLGARISDAMSPATDIAHLFVTQESRLNRTLPTLLRQLKPDGVIWVSWPKRASRVPTDITEDTIRAVALPLGLVDIKVCAVDEVWSGLKLVIRKGLRSA